jgi:hypothetical protein
MSLFALPFSTQFCFHRVCLASLACLEPLDRVRKGFENQTSLVFSSLHPVWANEKFVWFPSYCGCHCGSVSFSPHPCPSPVDYVFDRAGLGKRTCVFVECCDPHPYLSCGIQLRKIGGGVFHSACGKNAGCALAEKSCIHRDRCVLLDEVISTQW